jgi:hypothetical protein
MREEREQDTEKEGKRRERDEMRRGERKRVT